MHFDVHQRGIILQQQQAFDRWYAAGQIFTPDVAGMHCIFCLSAMTAIDSSKAKNRCPIYRERPAFFPSSEMED